MAANSVNMSVSTKDSDEAFDNNCFACARNGVIKEATKFCQDCDSSICVQCAKDHCKFPSLESHLIVDGPEFRSGRRLLTEHCATHPGRVLDRYCYDHDEVCCEACVVIKHRSCIKLNNVKESAKNIDDKEYGDTSEGLDKVISKIIWEQDKRNFHLSSLSKEKTVIMKDIDKFQDNVIKRIMEITDASRKEVRFKYDKLVNTTQADVRALETILAIAQESSKKLNTRRLNDAQKFVNMKNSKTVTKM